MFNLFEIVLYTLFIRMSSSLFVRAFHILVVGGLFLYLGTQRTAVPAQLFTGLIGLGLVVILYHLYKIADKIEHKKSVWVNLIHVLLVGPLLIYIGYFAENTERLYFELLLMMCFAVVGYHGYYLLNGG